MAELNRQLFAKVSDAIEAHPAWSRGLGLCGASTALKPEHVLDGESDAALSAEVRRFFGYDSQPLPNAGVAIPLRSCAARCWGLCQSDAVQPQATIGVYNIWALLHRWDLKRPAYPLVVSFSHVPSALAGHVAAPQRSSYFMLADTVGKGETVLLVGLQALGDDPAVFQLRRFRDAGFHVAACTTGQLALRACLRSWTTPPTPIRHLRFDVWGFLPQRVNRCEVAFRISDKALHGCVLPLEHKLSAAAPRKAAGLGKPEPEPPKLPKLPFGIIMPTRPESLAVAANFESDVGLPGLPEGPGKPNMKRKREGAGASIVVDGGGGDFFPGGEPDDDADVDDVDDDAADDAAAKAKDGDLDDIPGRRLGIVSFEAIGDGSRARCFVCVANGMPKEVYQIGAGGGKYKFFWRAKAGQVEKSLHCQCVVNGNILAYSTERARAQSARFLVDLLLASNLDAHARHVVMEAHDVMSQTPAPGASSSSSGTGVAAASAASAARAGAGAASASGGGSRASHI